MYILNLKTAEIIDHFREDFYSKVYPYLILSTACELKLLKDILDIDEITFNDCLEFALLYARAAFQALICINYMRLF